jgi:asparagine synthase (glutamine-hydrolysing)
MCGICGIYNFKNNKLVDLSLLGKMCDAMQHRGPDDHGYAAFQVPGSGFQVFKNQNNFQLSNFNFQPNLALGHRRLGIIDLSPAGHQPMSNENGTIWISYNGEIYNYLELGQDLKSKGHIFKSKTDTEVIIHAYEEWGIKCIQKFNGMFAFAIWDARRRKLFLARDRLGIKPLYYAQIGQQLVFASEIKAILQHPRFRREVNLDAINNYLAFRVVPEPQTAFRGIYSLLPGHLLVCVNGQITTRQYWDIPVAADQARKPLSYYTEGLRVHLEEVVRSHLISDVPLGAFLSGGIDSSAVVALMSQAMNEPVKTFSIGLGAGEERFDERTDARRVANHFGTDHHERIIQSGDVRRDLPRLIWSFEQPAATPIPNYYVSQFARQKVTVALCGLGADELFAGYPRHVGFRLAEWYDQVPQPLRRVFACMVERLPGSMKGYEGVRRVQKFVRGDGLSTLQRYAQWSLFFTEEMKGQLYEGAFVRSLQGDTLTMLKTYFDRCQAAHFPDKVLYVDMKTYLPNDLLDYADRMSMAHSLELRVPFLDHRLVEFVATIPYDLKLHGLTTKYILRKALGRLLPEYVFHKPKRGFTFPMGLWLNRDWRDLVGDTLSEEAVQRRGYFRYPYVKWLLDQHYSERRDFSYEVWALVVLELWHQVYVD